MTPQEEQLLERLRRYGVSGIPVSAVAAWSGFKDYAREVFGLENVGLLFQVGTFSLGGTRLFYFDPVCQFEIVDQNAEHDHFEQLHCEMTCAANDDLLGVKATLWSFDYPSADAFFDAVEALPEFQAAIRQPGYNMAVSYEAV